MKRTLKLLWAVMFAVIIGGIASSYAGVSPTLAIPAVGGALVLSSLYASQDGMALYSSTDLSAIARYAHQFQKSLISTLVNGLDIASDIMLMPNVKTSMKLPKISVGNGLRPYSGSTEFQTGDVTYTDRELKVQAGKREILIDSEEYRDKYLSLMLSPGSSATDKKIPFAQYLWSEVIKGVQREVNDEVAYFGFDKSDATAYAGASTYSVGDYVTFTVNGVLQYFMCVANTTAGDSPTSAAAKWQNVTARAVTPGLKSVIEDAIGSGITAVTTGAIDNTTGKEAYAAFLKLFREMPVPYKRAGVVINASYTDWEYLLDDLKTNFQYTVTDISNAMANGGLPLPLTEGKCTVKPATWLGDSRRLIAGPNSGGKNANLYLGTDLLSDLNQISTNENLWTLEAGIKAVLGFQIADLEAIRIGNQA